MPLIIHPSSCCDVCLEPLTYDEPRPPFAIPCGHIFCRECLHTMHPSVCPLCRKPFIPDRSKKLITGEREGDDHTALELLQRLVVSWPSEVSQQDRDTIITEAESWLGAGNTHEALAKCIDVVREYHVLRSERHENDRSLRRSHRNFYQLQLTQVLEREKVMAAEQNLLTQIQELQSQVAHFEDEREAMRNAASTTLTFRHNPLPRPPQPDPYFKNTTSFHASVQNTSGNYHSSRTAFYSEAPNIVDRKGKGREITAPLTPQSPNRSFVPSDDEVTGTPKNAIIPGASPGQRFVPKNVYKLDPDPGATWQGDPQNRQFLSQDPETINPYPMVEGYLNEYVDGFVEGYQFRQQLKAPPPSRPSQPHRSATTPSDPTYSLLGPPVPPNPSSHRSTHGSAAVWGSSGQGLPTVPHSAPLQPGFNFENSSFIWPVVSPSPTPMASASTSQEAPHDRSQTLTSQPAPMTAPVGHINYTETSSQPSHHSSRSRYRQRRLSDVTTIETSWRPRETPPHIQPPPSDSSLRRRHAVTGSSQHNRTGSVHEPGSNPMVNGERVSIVGSASSWGTVNTANPAPPETQPIHTGPRFIPVHDIISVRDLQLRGFDDIEVEDLSSRRTSLLSDGLVLPSHRTSLLSEPGILFMPQNEDSWANTEVNGRVQLGQRITPRGALTRSLSLADSASAVGPSPSRTSRTSNGHRAATLTSYHSDDRGHETPVAPPITPGPRYLPELTPSQASSRSHSRSQSHLYASSTSNSHHSSRTSRHHIYRPVSPPSAETDTQPTLSYSSHWAEATTAPTANALGLSDFSLSELAISAPTPTTTSTRAFLRSFSNDSYH